MQEKLTESGIPCNLLTGQEQIIFPGCQKMSCTVEMVSTESEFDVAVIDEIQMIGIVIQYIYSGCCYSLAKKKATFVRAFSSFISVATARLDIWIFSGDTSRGHAWTRALLGLNCHEIHVCGDMTAVSLLKELCTVTGDKFELRTYERLSPLALSQPLNRFKPSVDFQNIYGGCLSQPCTDVRVMYISI